MNKKRSGQKQSFADVLENRCLQNRCSCEIYEILKDIFFYRTPPLAASEWKVTAVRTPKSFPFFSYLILFQLFDVFKFQCSSFLWWLCWHDNIFGADKHISIKSKLKFDKIPQDITSIIGRSMVIPLFKISGLSLLKAIC